MKFSDDANITIVQTKEVKWIQGEGLTWPHWTNSALHAMECGIGLFDWYVQH